MNNSHIWSEEQLVLELKSKNPRAIEYLYNAYHKKIFAFILYLIKNNDDSQDILQDVFVKFWLNIENYNPKISGIYTWMINITRNHCLDKFKSNQYKYSQSTFDINEASKSIDHSSLHIDNIGIKDNLNKLNLQHAEVIDLIYFKGYTQSEAANVLNKPLGTIKTHIRNAISELKTIIKVY